MKHLLSKKGLNIKFYYKSFSAVLFGAYQLPSHSDQQYFFKLLIVICNYIYLYIYLANFRLGSQI